MNCFSDLEKWCRDRKVAFLAVDSYGDTVERAKRYVEEFKISFQVLMDESTGAAQAFGAKKVTSTFVFDPEGKLRYRGALDNGKEGAERVLYPAEAAREILEGKEVSRPETRAFG
jgi:peroxiredoxin